MVETIAATLFSSATAAGTATAATSAAVGASIAANTAIFGTAAAAATGGGFLATLGTIASVVGTVASLAAPFMATGAQVAATGGAMALDVQSGKLAEDAAENEAAQIEEQMQYESLRAQQEENSRQATLNRVLASQMAASAGRGIQINSGSMLAIAEESLGQKEKESDVASLDLSFRQRMLQHQARQVRLGGQAGLLKGYSAAANKGISAVGSIADRIGTFGNVISKGGDYLEEKFS